MRTLRVDVQTLLSLTESQTFRNRAKYSQPVVGGKRERAHPGDSDESDPDAALPLSAYPWNQCAVPKFCLPGARQRETREAAASVRLLYRQGHQAGVRSDEFSSCQCSCAVCHAHVARIFRRMDASHLLRHLLQRTSRRVAALAERGRGCFGRGRCCAFGTRGCRQPQSGQPCSRRLRRCNTASG